jgi:hypothetical protein
MGTLIHFSPSIPGKARIRPIRQTQRSGSSGFS